MEEFLEKISPTPYTGRRGADIEIDLELKTWLETMEKTRLFYFVHLFLIKRQSIRTEVRLLQAGHTNARLCLLIRYLDGN